MKRNQLTNPALKDTPSTRKRRLQARLHELSNISEQELKVLMKSVEKVKAAFSSKKPSA